MGTSAFCPTALDKSITEFKLIPNNFPFPCGQGQGDTTLNEVYVTEEPEHVTTK